MHSDDVPNMVYAIGGRRWMKGVPGFAEAIANAHSARQRPRCLCVPEGIETYVARLAGPHGGYIVKRMPNTGHLHATTCPSYELPPDHSGLGAMLGSAIAEDPETGETLLKLNFSLTKLPGRAQMPPTGGESATVTSDGTKLSLRGLLHYLWDQAELNRWHPGFSGKRSWGTVRKYLLMAAANKIARGNSLLSRLYIPEAFSVEQRDAINARRQAQWHNAMAEPGKPQQLMLLICEVKEIAPARFGFKAVVKHAPDQPFALDEQLYRRLGRHFETELALWSSVQDIHLVMIATFSISPAGLPTIIELSLMPVTGQWLPIEDAFEKQLIDRLVADGRSFVKGLRYDLSTAQALASAILTDCDGAAPTLFLVRSGIADASQQRQFSEAATPAWEWDPSSEAMPSLPPRHLHPRTTVCVPHSVPMRSAYYSTPNALNTASTGSE